MLTRPAFAPRVLLTLLAALLASLSLAGPASAKTTFGYGDGRVEWMSDPQFKSLKIKDTRRLVEWDTRTDPAKVAQLDTWMAAAKADKLRVLVAIDRSWTPKNAKKKPSTKTYTALIKWLRSRYPQVKYVTPWNEANFRDQPTYKKPSLAVTYYRAAKSACGRKCTVTSPTILVGKTVSTKWLKSFLKSKTARSIKLWSVHNYGDMNRGKGTYAGISTFQKMVPRGDIWITEAAGWVTFLADPATVAKSGKAKYPYSEKRAANAIKFAFKTAKKYKRIKRMYFWQWNGDASKNVRWDSGVMNADFTPRLGYRELQKGLKAAK